MKRKSTARKDCTGVREGNWQFLIVRSAKYYSEVIIWFVVGVQSIFGYSSAYLTCKVVISAEFGSCENSGVSRRLD